MSGRRRLIFRGALGAGVDIAAKAYHWFLGSLARKYGAWDGLPSAAVAAKEGATVGRWIRPFIWGLRWR